MSGSIVGGLVGAAIGIMVPGIGWAIGWTAGSIIGGLLFPQTVDGPRLEDLKPQASEYGRPIPITYGTIAIGGNVIWASDFVEEEGEAGGKGGGGSSTYSYYGNFAVAICEGGADKTLGRIFAGPEKRLIWDGAILEGADAGATLTFYNGAEDQLPDPLMESYEGVGNVPAYRGTAYIVLEHFPLLKDGNRIPFLTIEIGNVASSAAPENLGTVWIQQVLVTASYYIAFYNGSFQGIVIRNLSDNTLVAHYTYESAAWDTNWEFFFDEDRQVIVRPNIDSLTYTTIPVSTGVMANHDITSAVGGESDPGTDVKGGVYHNGTYIFGAAGSSVANRVTLYGMDPDTHEPTFTYAQNTAAGAFVGPLLAPIDATAAVYGYSSPQRLSQFNLAGSGTPVDLGTPAPSASSVRVDPNTGYIWSIALASGVLHVYCNDPGTASLIYTESLVVDASELAPGDALTFVAGSPNTVIVSGEQWLGIDWFARFNADVPAYLGQVSGGYHGTSDIHSLAYNSSTDGLMAFRYAGWITFGEDKTDPSEVNYLQAGTFTPETDNKYLGEADGSVDPQGQPLSEIVADLSERAGLTSAQYDVTALTDLVDGYAIERATTAREAITALMPAYFFDAVESGGVAKFVKRGGAIAAVIDDDELGAHESGTEGPDPLESTRRMENELPETLFVRYLLEATNYSPASKYARRLVGASGDEQTLDLPLVLTDTKAQEIAEVNLHGAWVGRISYRHSLPRKYAYLEPTDIIVVLNHTMRIEKMKYVGGRFACECRHDDSNVYVPNVVVTETPPTGGTVAVNTEIVLELM